MSRIPIMEIEDYPSDHSNEEDNMGEEEYMGE